MEKKITWKLVCVKSDERFGVSGQVVNDSLPFDMRSELRCYDGNRIE